MTSLIHELLATSASRTPNAPAIKFRKTEHNYAQVAGDVQRFASALIAAGLARQERVAVYLPKRPETVATIFGTTMAGGVFVPVNPLLKPPQVGHILRDCAVRVLVTTAQRLTELADELAASPELRLLVVLDGTPATAPPGKTVVTWDEFMAAGPGRLHRVIDTDMAAILYTSGSTGKPKGVVLSHKNMVTGAKSVAQYLENHADDRLLAVLPLSFDYGFSQLSTAFHVGASVVLMDYLFPRDVLNLVVNERITGLAAVPPVWIQLAELEWPATVTEHLRYFTNSGGAMPTATLAKLRAAWPKTKPYLMYGLTEAFRATYLPPEEVDRRPESMGKAIPNTEVMVVRPDGTPCDPDEPGELVQRGSLVALGYWNDPAKTAERFKPAPGQPPELCLTEMAVWSGDTVKKDQDGFLYFIGRKDEMIKTSGYRVSPTEVEEVAYASGMVGDAVAVAAPHPDLGQAIVLVVSRPSHCGADPLPLRRERVGVRVCSAFLKSRLPNFMVPHHIAWLPELPRNPNGKFDRPALAAQFKTTFRPPADHARRLQPARAAPVLRGEGRRTADRRPQGLRARGRDRPHAVLRLRPRGDDPQGAGTAGRLAARGRDPLRDEGQPDAGGGAALLRPGGRHRPGIGGRDGRGARRRHATRAAELRGPGQDAGRTRARRGRGRRDQHGIARWRCGASPTSPAAPARARRLPFASTRTSS